MTLQIQMKLFFSILLLTVALHAQDFTVSKFALPSAPKPRFWTVEKDIEFGLLAGLVAADGLTTQRGLDEGLREVNPLLRPLVTRGVGGQAVASTMSLGSALGFAYVLHRTHHYKVERVATRLMLVDASGVVINNIVRIR